MAKVFHLVEVMICVQYAEMEVNLFYATDALELFMLVRFSFFPFFNFFMYSICACGLVSRFVIPFIEIVADCLGLQCPPENDWHCPHCKDRLGSGRKASGESRPIIL